MDGELAVLEKEERSVKVAMCVITCPQDALTVVEDQDEEHMPNQPNSMNSVRIFNFGVKYGWEGFYCNIAV